MTEAKLSQRLEVGNRLLQLIALCRKQQKEHNTAGFLDNAQIQGLRDSGSILVPPCDLKQTPSSMSPKPSPTVARKAEREAFAESKASSSAEEADDGWKIGAGRQAGEGLADGLGIDTRPDRGPSGIMADTIKALSRTQ